MRTSPLGDIAAVCEYLGCGQLPFAVTSRQTGRAAALVEKQLARMSSVEHCASMRHVDDL
eukprot:6184027-Pleurochrysis_carterae.AAC.5